MYHRSFVFDPLITIKFGVGIRESIGQEANRFAAKKVLIVTDKDIVKAGLVDKIKEPLKASKVEMLVFDEVEPNPRDKDVDRGNGRHHQERIANYPLPESGIYENGVHEV